MDPAKAAFLFGAVPSWADPDDADDRRRMLSLLVDSDEETWAVPVAIFEVIADQVADDDPPEVWQTAQRMLSLGLDRGRILSELAMVLANRLDGELGGSREPDMAGYVADLAVLPLPNPGQMTEALVAVARELQPVDQDGLFAEAVTRLGGPPGQGAYLAVLDHVFEDGLGEGMFAYLCDDRVVHVQSFYAGAVFTHRLSAPEAGGGYLDVEADFVFESPGPIEGPGGAEVDESWRPEAGLVWEGPKDWLEDIPAGTVLAARDATGDGSVVIEALRTPPAVDDAAVAALRSAYELAVADLGLPVSTNDLALEMLAQDRHFFDQPRAPLSELVLAAGLERRGDEVAEGPEVWQRAAQIRQASRVRGRARTRADADAALKVIRTFNEGLWDDAALLREVGPAMRDQPAIADLVADELLGLGAAQDREPAEHGAEVHLFAARLLDVCRKPADIAVARWFMALAAERAGDTAAAESQLHLAVEAGSDWAPPVDRLAWYLSDKGEAAEAARLWRSLGTDPGDPELANVEQHARRTVTKLGRNEPCWCGSGRKFKVCHLGQPQLAPLAERTGWLIGKAISYLHRQVARATPDIVTVAAARADGDDSEAAMKRAFSDPITLDLVLTEGGWFEHFLEERGSLLPEDEALLAASWALVDRTIYEVVSVRPGAGVTLKDLRSAEEVDVQERMFSREASPGLLVCGRAVPDGRGHQLMGGIFPVRTGTEAELLDLLDEGDPEEIAAWVARLERPPVLNNREGEATVMCRAVTEVPVPAQARRALDRLYGPGSDGTWHERFQLNDDEAILRATLRLEGSQLSVETNSEQRMDRALATLKEAIPELKVLSEQRTPLELGELGRSIGSEGGGPGEPAGDHGGGPLIVPAEVREQYQAMFESRWCDENVPALNGLTPRQAAADPSRRESLERLLTEFERMDSDLPPEGITMRPGRLREMLGLP